MTVDRSHHYSEEDKATIRRMFAEGRPDIDIAAVLNRPVTGIIYQRKILGLTRVGGVMERAWTAQENEIIQNGVNNRLSYVAIARQLPDRTAQQVSNHARNVLGLRRKLQYFTEQDVAFITDQWVNKGAEDRQIAAALNRDIGTIRQKIHHLGLNRDRRRTRLARRFGVSMDDPRSVEQIHKDLEQKNEAQRALERDTKLAAKNKTLDQMQEELANGTSRRVAFQTAMLSGVTLQDIGDRVGLTRERVRQVVHRTTAFETIAKAVATLAKLNAEDYEYAQSVILALRAKANSSDQ